MSHYVETVLVYVTFLLFQTGHQTDQSDGYPFSGIYLGKPVEMVLPLLTSIAARQFSLQAALLIFPLGFGLLLVSMQLFRDLSTPVTSS